MSRSRASSPSTFATLASSTQVANSSAASSAINLANRESDVLNHYVLLVNELSGALKREAQRAASSVHLAQRDNGSNAHSLLPPLSSIAHALASTKSRILMDFHRFRGFALRCFHLALELDVFASQRARRSVLLCAAPTDEQNSFMSELNNLPSLAQLMELQLQVTRRLRQETKVEEMGKIRERKERERERERSAQQRNVSSEYEESNANINTSRSDHHHHHHRDHTHNGHSHHQFKEKSSERDREDRRSASRTGKSDRNSSDTLSSSYGSTSSSSSSSLRDFKTPPEHQKRNKRKHADGGSPRSSTSTPLPSLSTDGGSRTASPAPASATPKGGSRLSALGNIQPSTVPSKGWDHDRCRREIFALRKQDTQIRNIRRHLVQIFGEKVYQENAHVIGGIMSAVNRQLLSQEEKDKDKDKDGGGKDRDREKEKEKRSEEEAMRKRAAEKSAEEREKDRKREREERRERRRRKEEQESERSTSRSNSPVSGAGSELVANQSPSLQSISSSSSSLPHLASIPLVSSTANASAVSSLDFAMNVLSAASAASIPVSMPLPGSGMLGVPSPMTNNSLTPTPLGRFDSPMPNQMSDGPPANQWGYTEDKLASDDDQSSHQRSKRMRGTHSSHSHSSLSSSLSSSSSSRKKRGKTSSSPVPPGSSSAVKALNAFSQQHSQAQPNLRGNYGSLSMLPILSGSMQYPPSGLSAQGVTLAMALSPHNSNQPISALGIGGVSGSAYHFGQDGQPNLAMIMQQHQQQQAAHEAAITSLSSLADIAAAEDAARRQVAINSVQIPKDELSKSRMERQLKDQQRMLDSDSEQMPTEPTNRNFDNTAHLERSVLSQMTGGSAETVSKSSSRSTAEGNSSGLYDIPPLDAQRNDSTSSANSHSSSGSVGGGGSGLTSDDDESKDRHSSSHSHNRRQSSASDSPNQQSSERSNHQFKRRSSAYTEEDATPAASSTPLAAPSSAASASAMTLKNDLSPDDGSGFSSLQGNSSENSRPRRQRQRTGSSSRAESPTGGKEQPASFDSSDPAAVNSATRRQLRSTGSK